MPTSLAMLRTSRLLSHIIRVCMTLTFSSAVSSFGRPDLPSYSMLSLSSNLNSAAHFSTVIKEGDSVTRVSMKSSWISLGGIPFMQKYLLTALISSFSSLQMCHTPSLKSPKYISNQAWPHAFHTLNALQIKWPTDKKFNSMNRIVAYRSEDFLITPRIPQSPSRLLGPNLLSSNLLRAC